MSAGARWSVGIVIPACDEEASIQHCLGAVRAAVARSTAVASSWIVVVADACRDKTAAVARSSLQGCGEVIECNARSPGIARGLGTARLLEHFSQASPSELWLANTDADTAVSEEWIVRQLELADRGFSAVAGIVRVESVESHRPEVVRSLMQDYAIGADGSHPHVHGANLGVRADAYLDAGGWSNLALAEDHCLWGRLRARGWRIVSSIASVVVTSGRLHGRASGGFADSLRRKVEQLYA